ncbi:MAG: helix-turn-helix domain-containing protein [Desulfonauticus sp.]|nr:helix-turn-helix domain-containing protein [Desulfonauticus sp.]
MKHIKEKKQIGERFRHAIQSAGLSTQELAKFLGKNERTITQWWRGERELKGSILSVLAQNFGINPAYVLIGKGEPLLEDKPQKITSHILFSKKKEKRYDTEEEEFLREKYFHLVTVLENISGAIKVVLESYKEGSKPFEIARKIAKAPVELLPAVVFAGFQTHFQKLVVSFWRFYWSLYLSVIPLPEDVANISLLVSRKQDIIDSIKELEEKFKVKYISEKDIEELRQTYKPPVKPGEKVEFEFLRFLRVAASQLEDLHRSSQLPHFCLVHHKAYFTSCPICWELEQKEEK